MKQTKSVFFETAKVVRLVHALILFNCVILLGCPSSNKRHGNKGGDVPAIVRTDSIEITSIEVRPNPIHIWPDPNPKFNGCSIVIGFKNVGEADCKDNLHFYAYFSKADNNLNNSFGAAQAMPISTEWTKGLMYGQNAYGEMDMDLWLYSMATSGKDLNATYKVTIKGYRAGNNGTLLEDHISENSPATLFQIVHHR